MNHETALYEKALRKQLHCTGNAKKHLLQQFRSSLAAYLDEHPSPTGADLRDAFGPPEDMSKILMESVSEAEIARFYQQRKWKRIIAAIIATLLLTLMLYIAFWKEKPITSNDSIVIEPIITSPTEGR